MKRKYLFLILLICGFVLMGCGKKEIDSSQYLNKIWVIEDDDGVFESKVSFYITSFENGNIEGKIQLKEGIVIPKSCKEEDIDNVSDYVGDFSGEYTRDGLECTFQTPRGDKGKMLFRTLDSNIIKMSIKSTKGKRIRGTYSFRPYNLSDKKNFTLNEEFSREVELDSWGKVWLMSGRIDNIGKGTYYPVVFLTDADKNILYEFNTGYTAGTEVYNVAIEDMNEDGLKDISIVTWVSYFKDDDYFLIKSDFYQMNDGRFYLNKKTEDGEIVQDSIKNQELSWEWIIEPGEFQYLYFIGNGMVKAVDSDGKTGVFNEKGEVIVPFEYDDISEFYSGIACAIKDQRAIYIDVEGNKKWDCDYEDAQGFSEDKAAIKKDGKWGFIDLQGEEIIFCQYDEVKPFSEEIAAVKKDGKWGFINKEGNPISGCIYDDVKDFQEGYAAVMQNGLWGFLDKSGKIQIELKYNNVNSFSEGKAAVSILENETEKWAYINQEDQIVIDYDVYTAIDGLMNYVGDFHNGIAFVSKDLYSIIDERGQIIFDGQDSRFFISALSYIPEYDIIPVYIYTDEAMKVKKYGFMGLDGETRLEPVFDYIGDIDGEYAIVWDSTDNARNAMGVIKLVK